MQPLLVSRRRNLLNKSSRCGRARHSPVRGVRLWPRAQPVPMALIGSPGVGMPHPPSLPLPVRRGRGTGGGGNFDPAAHAVGYSLSPALRADSLNVFLGHNARFAPFPKPFFTAFCPSIKSSVTPIAASILAGSVRFARTVPRMNTECPPLKGRENAWVAVEGIPENPRGCERLASSKGLPLIRWKTVSSPRSVSFWSFVENDRIEGISHELRGNRKEATAVCCAAKGLLWQAWSSRDPCAPSHRACEPL
jgi:hypothetical protein